MEIRGGGGNSSHMKQSNGQWQESMAPLWQPGKLGKIVYLSQTT